MQNAEQEKRSAALASIGAALLLTGLKLGVGLATNSLGVLSEALHSGLDFMAAALTYIAVRYASAPPDPGHPYGHGKAENLSALTEALLLLITCVWIVHEAVNRLFFSHVPVAPSAWAVGVMVVSIIVDLSRSRMLMKAARKHKSQALEADALHFSTDILSSVVVIAGLGGIYLAGLFPPGSFWNLWLQKADALSALGVSAIIVKVSLDLGKRAVNVLLDAGDVGLDARIRLALAALPGVDSVKDLRLRHSGPDLLVDLTAVVSSSLLMSETVKLRTDIERAVMSVVPDARVNANFAPRQGGGLMEELHAGAAARGLKPHAVEILELMEADGLSRRLVEMHVEMNPEMPLAEAHEIISAFEGEMRGRRPDLILVTHMEPRSKPGEESYASPEQRERIRRAITDIAMGHPSVCDCHSIIARDSLGEASVTFHCRMDGKATVEEAHKAASKIQAELHRELPEIRRVTIHMEPLK